MRCVNYTAKIQLSIIHGVVHELSMLSEIHIACVGMETARWRDSTKDYE